MLPPPAEVELVLAEDAEPAFLVARAGVDRDVLRRHGEALREHRIRFDVLLDGAPTYSGQVELVSRDRKPGTTWLDVGAEQRIFSGLDALVASRPATVLLACLALTAAAGAVGSSVLTSMSVTQAPLPQGSARASTPISTGA